MKICLVSPYDLSLEGGVNKHIFYLAKSLRALGDKVEIIGPRSGRAPEGEDVTCFSGIVSIQGNESDNRIGLLTSPLAVRRYMHQRNFDILHIHEPFVPSLPYYALWTTDARGRVATFHRYSEREGRTTRLVRQALSPHLRGFQRGIAVSDAAARYAQVAWPRPLSIIPNGVDTTFFTPPQRGDPREGAAMRLLFVGQWTDKRKGLPVLLDAYALLRARQIEVTLDVVGQGDPGIPTPAGIHGLSFYGRVSEAELRRRFRECDIFVAPSTGQESFGMVLVEAMAAGRPVVCSDIDGYRDVVTSRGARLVPPNNPAALSDVLQALYRDHGMRRAMGLHNRAESLRYDWGNIAGQVREEYEMALRNSRPRSLLGRQWMLYRQSTAGPMGADEAGVPEQDQGRVASAGAKR